jgi:hypothetical protein
MRKRNFDDVDQELPYKMATLSSSDNLPENPLNHPDALMDINIHDSIQKILLSSTQSPLALIQTLSEHFRGYSGLIQRLLQLIKKCNHRNLDPDEVLQSCFTKVMISHFNKDYLDALISNSQTVPSWLNSLIEIPAYRQTLIDLGVTEKNCAFLSACIREICLQGFHQEVLSRVVEIEYLDLFNKIFPEMFNGPASVHLHRLCYSTDYLSLYSADLLSYLRDIVSSTQSISIKLKVLKWLQDLEIAALDKCQLIGRLSFNEDSLLNQITTIVNQKELSNTDIGFVYEHFYRKEKISLLITEFQSVLARLYQQLLNNMVSTAFQLYDQPTQRKLVKLVNFLGNNPQGNLYLLFHSFISFFYFIHISFLFFIYRFHRNTTEKLQIFACCQKML